MAWWRRSEYARTVVFVLLLTVGAWELAVRMFGIRTFLLPPPSLVAMEIFNNPGFYAFQSLYTIYITAIGFALAVISESASRSRSCRRSFWTARFTPC